jgi:hypothetical protein
MNFRVHYSRAQEITPGGFDGRIFGFHVTYVPSEYFGGAEEEQKTEKHRIAVSIHGTTAAIWNLSEEHLVRVLFEFARKFLKDALSRSAQFATYAVEGPAISTATHRGNCPYNPERLARPEEFIEEVIIEKRMGFGASMSSTGSHD